jgi:hypothetical protein
MKYLIYLKPPHRVHLWAGPQSQYNTLPYPEDEKARARRAAILRRIENSGASRIEFKPRLYAYSIEMEPELKDEMVKWAGVRKVIEVK